MTDKNELRTKAKNIRKNLPIKEISEKLADLISQNEFYISARNIMVFYPTEFEIDLRKLFNDDKNFYLPRVDGEKLLVCPYIIRHSEDQNFQTLCYAQNDGEFFPEESHYKSPMADINLKKSSYGIYEPCSNPIAPEILDLVIVPALMCDVNGYRLGYGGGFYDKFISKYGKNFKTICAVPKELFIKNLPHDKSDQKVDVVLKV